MTEFIAYTPKQWRSKEFIRANDLNHIEQGISTNNELIEDLIENGTGISEETKEYVNEAINQSNAFFRGSFNTKAGLLSVQWQTLDDEAQYYVSNNDYAYIVADETHNNEAWRYIYVYEKNGQNNGWQAQYRINETPFTITQMNAIDSGITSAKVDEIGQVFTGATNQSAGIKGVVPIPDMPGKYLNSDGTWKVLYQIMTMAQYEALTQEEKMDGTIRFITDANAYPDAGGVGF